MKDTTTDNVQNCDSCTFFVIWTKTRLSLKANSYHTTWLSLIRYKLLGVKDTETHISSRTVIYGCCLSLLCTLLPYDIVVRDLPCHFINIQLSTLSGLIIRPWGNAQIIWRLLAFGTDQLLHNMPSNSTLQFADCSCSLECTYQLPLSEFKNTPWNENLNNLRN
jgi:hypothetical protein